MSDTPTDLPDEELPEPEEVIVPLNVSERLRTIADQFEAEFGEAITLRDDFQELTIDTTPEHLEAIFRYAKDVIQCQYLIDVSAVHWPAGAFVRDTEMATTGWPQARRDQEGSFEIVYILRSLTPPTRFRVRVTVSDIDATVISADQFWRSANFMEREVYDLMGITFTGHPNMTRIMMPDEWVGHPLRKDYGLGGVEVEFEGKTVPPADERDY